MNRVQGPSHHMIAASTPPQRLRTTRYASRWGHCFRYTASRKYPGARNGTNQRIEQQAPPELFESSA